MNYEMLGVIVIGKGSHETVLLAGVCGVAAVRTCSRQEGCVELQCPLSPVGLESLWRRSWLPERASGGSWLVLAAVAVLQWSGVSVVDPDRSALTVACGDRCAGLRWVGVVCFLWILPVFFTLCVYFFVYALHQWRKCICSRRTV